MFRLFYIYLLFVSLTVFIKIQWDNRYAGDVGNDCLISVDCTDFMIGEPFPYARKASKVWYSFKFKGPGLRYEVGLNIKTGDIVWINGPFLPGSWTDSKIFRDGMVKGLDRFERVEADAGYKAHDLQFARTPYSLWNKDRMPELRNCVQARHETVNRRFKQYGSLQQRFRHDWKLHCNVFCAVAVITQVAIKSGEKLFDIADYFDEEPKMINSIKT